ncbi:MAG TPA: hypothetical protein PKA31_03240 [Candidatus Moranbacteria bacterium]|nr:hypothetical protein [Candidatus Moranbacteria bacterium]
MKIKFNVSALGKMAASFWRKMRNWLLVLLLLAFAFLGGYVWYRSLFGSGWSAQQKQEFIATQDKNVRFKEKSFDETLGKIRARREKFEGPLENTRNIFLEN